MKTIKIDDEVWELLKTAAVPFEDEPNDALRRLLKLPDTRRSTPANGTARSADTIVRHKVGTPPQAGRFDRTKIEEAVLQIVKEHGGQISVKDPITGFNIYEEVGDRLGIPRDVRKELTPAGENRWRAEVGFARKNLEQRGAIAPTSESGRGVWRLK